MYAKREEQEHIPKATAERKEEKTKIHIREPERREEAQERNLIDVHSVAHA